jgi:hypothetical protein
MKPSRTLFVAILLAAFALAASAQPKPGAPGASGSGMGMDMPGGMHGRAGADNTYGWAMMTPQEREEHQKKMMDMKSRGECKSYADKHHQQMADRAKQHGVPAPGTPPHDMCDGMK